MAKTTEKKPSREDWHPADIVAALHKRGLTLRDIARHHGLKDSSTLSKAMIQSYPAAERRLAEAAGIPVHVMFASRYTLTGEQIPRGIRGQRKIKSTEFYCQRNGNYLQAV